MIKYRNKNNFTFADKDLRKYKSVNKIQKNRIIFLGTANISQINWCDLYTYYKCKKEELMFMSLYFHDLIKYLKMMNKLQLNWHKKKILFNIEVPITVSEIESILNNTKEINLDFDYHITETNANFERGKKHHNTKAEKYKTIRWHLKQDERIIIGSPDGITHDFVYEFKSTKNVGKMKRTAFLQANFYAFMFNKTNIRVQIYNYMKDELHTYEEQRDRNSMLEILNRIKNIENGNIPINISPYKCRNCIFRENCVLAKRNKHGNSI